MTTWAVIPAKAFSRAKSRLAPALGARHRAALARAMLAHVLAVTRACRAIDATMVVTDGHDVARAAAAAGAHVVYEASAALPSVIATGLRAATGATRAAIVMGDLPLLGVDDIEALLSLLGASELVIAPDRHGVGTNAAALALPSRYTLRFGEPRSFAAHLGAAPDAAVCSRYGLAFDIDAPGDLVHLEDTPSPPAPPP